MTTMNWLTWSFSVPQFVVFPVLSFSLMSLLEWLSFLDSECVLSTSEMSESDLWSISFKTSTEVIGSRALSFSGPLLSVDVEFCLSVGSRALSFSGPLLSVDVEFCLLVRERSALADPYCQSTWNSVCLSVCLSATLRSNISKTKGARAKVTMGS